MAEVRTKVYVVMGNDYPDAVFDNEAAATAYCEKMNGSEPFRIHWRWCDFTLLQDMAEKFAPIS